MEQLHKHFIELIRQGIGHGAYPLMKNVDWYALTVLAERHGLSAVVLDGLEKIQSTSKDSKESNDQEFENSRISKVGTNQLNSTNVMPLEMKLEWIGEVLQNYEGRYAEYKKAIGSLAGLYNRHGFKMMVLKGYACSLNWPKPEHRPCGDIDIWQFGKQKEADRVLSNTNGTNLMNKIEIDNSHHHHSVFEWGEFTVENHYDFINVHHHRSSAELERIFKELGMNDTCTVDVCGEKVYLPSPNLHALFLLKHSMSDFAAFFITLRQVLDWGFHVQKYHDEIDWDWLKEVMEMYHMTEFFNTINAICVEDLGFESSIFPYLQFNPMLKEKVLLDIMEPKFPREEPHGLVKRMIFKFRRWKGNSWKHEMCYNESLWSAFWSGLWNHVTKPASI